MDRMRTQLEKTASGSADRTTPILSAAILLILIATPSVPAQTPDGPSEPAPVQPTVQQLIKELSSPRWRTREIAAARLEQMGSSINDALRDAFQSAAEYEVRNRIKLIAQEIYLNETIGPIKAFLGIQHRGYDSMSTGDGRIQPGMTGIQLTMVVWGSAASMAGLKAGDMIIGLNGSRGTQDNAASGFMGWIGQQTPGTTCTLTVLRGGEGRLLMNSGEAHFDPRGFSKVSVRLVTSEEEPRLTPGSAGLYLEDVSRADPRLRLEAGDLVLGLDGEMLHADTAVQDFKNWADGKSKPLEEDVVQRMPAFQVGPGGRVVVGMPRPSIQLMRGGRILEVEVTLLGRPPNLERGRVWQRGDVSSARLREADLAFEALWDSTVGRNGPPADRRDAAALWRMDR